PCPPPPLHSFPTRRSSDLPSRLLVLVVIEVDLVVLVVVVVIVFTGTKTQRTHAQQQKHQYGEHDDDGDDDDDGDGHGVRTTLGRSAAPGAHRNPGGRCPLGEMRCSPGLVWTWAKRALPWAREESEALPGQSAAR